MKVLHIITGLGDGGAEAVLFRLCTSDRNYHRIVVSMMDDGKYGALLRGKGIEVYCLGMRPGRLSISGITILWKLLKFENPSVVQTWMYHANFVGGMVAKIAGIRRIIWGIHHTVLLPGKSKRSTIYLSRISALLSYWVPQRIVCCAIEAYKVHQALGYAKHKFVVIPNGYDLTKFIPDRDSRSRLRSEFLVNEKTLLLGMVGRFDPLKDHFNLIDSIGYLKKNGCDFKCVLVGRDVNWENAELTQRLDRVNVRDCVLLLNQRQDIPAIMNALDLHILSSCAEAFPNVLAEAMACSTPCVTTDVGDAAYIVGDTGWVVPPCDPEALYHGIEMGRASRSSVDEWGNRKSGARARIVANFSLVGMISKYSSVWSGSAHELES